MDELQILLLRRIDELTSIIEAARDCIAQSPEGSLHISMNQNTIQYYRRTEVTDTHGTYIKKSEVQLIQQLAQKGYAKKMYSKATIECDTLTRCFKKYQPEALKNIYHNLKEPRQRLVKPFIMPDEEYITLWKDRKQKEKIRYGKNDLLLVPEEEAILTEQAESQIKI